MKQLGLYLLSRYSYSNIMTVAILLYLIICAIVYIITYYCPQRISSERQYKLYKLFVIICITIIGFFIWFFIDMMLIDS